LTDGNFVASLKESEELKLFDSTGNLLKVVYHPQEVLKLRQFSDDKVAIADINSLKIFSKELEFLFECENSESILDFIELTNGQILIVKNQSELLTLKKNGTLLYKSFHYDSISSLMALNSSDFSFATTSNCYCIL
jgi:hypothetical protein